MVQIRDAKFRVGQIVRHRFFPFRGVIFDVDAVFSNTEEWWLSIPEDVRPEKDQPFYHLLAENEQSNYVAYVSEQNLLPDETGLFSLQLVEQRVARPVAAFVVGFENLPHLRMPHRLTRGIEQQILLRHIGDVFRLRVFREQVIEGLVLARPDFLGDRQPPFLGVVEFRVDVENHAAERE